MLLNIKRVDPVDSNPLPDQRPHLTENVVEYHYVFLHQTVYSFSFRVKHTILNCSIYLLS